MGYDFILTMGYYCMKTVDVNFSHYVMPIFSYERYNCLSNELYSFFRLHVNIKLLNQKKLMHMIASFLRLILNPPASILFRTFPAQEHLITILIQKAA